LKELLEKITSTKDIDYRIRVQVCIILTELLLISLILFWPTPDPGQKKDEIVYTDEELNLEPPTITKQTTSPPPPPQPSLPPEPVPDDVIEEEIEIEEQNLPDVLEPSELEGPGIMDSNDNELQIVSNPQMPPSVVKIVEPVVPEAAKKAGIKAEIWVNFLVNKNGSVEEATISEIKIYDKEEDKYVTVKSIGYGLVEATLKAAMQWRFRPAKEQGEKVSSYTKHIFTYGN